MSELFFANLSHTPNPGKMAFDARSNLVDFEDYLRRAKKQIESTVPLSTWEIEGEYHSLSSISESPDDIRKVLADRDAYELRFINKQAAKFFCLIGLNVVKKIKLTIKYYCFSFQAYS